MRGDGSFIPLWHNGYNAPRPRRFGSLENDCGAASDRDRHRCRIVAVAGTPVLRPSARPELLRQHHQDAAGAAEIGQLVDVLVGRDAAKRVAAVPRGDREGLVDVVD